MNEPKVLLTKLEEYFDQNVAIPVCDSRVAVSGNDTDVVLVYRMRGGYFAGSWNLYVYEKRPGQLVVTFVPRRANESRLHLVGFADSEHDALILYEWVSGRRAGYSG